MIGSHKLSSMLTALKSASGRQRDIAAAELDDLIEADVLDDRQLEKVIHSLLAHVLEEPDLDAQESMFNALSSACFSPISLAIDWQPIASSLEVLDIACLEHALI